MRTITDFKQNKYTLIAHTKPSRNSAFRVTKPELGNGSTEAPFSIQSSIALVDPTPLSQPSPRTVSALALVGRVFLVPKPEVGNDSAEALASIQSSTALPDLTQ
jgi:hypothetical protein